MIFNQEIIDFIKKSKLSYRNIIIDVDKKFKKGPSKSTISYYKRAKHRLVNLNLDKVSQKDMEWLKGFFIADGSKFIERKYAYVIKFALDNKNDKDILKKLIRILYQLGCKFSVRKYRNVAIIRTFSKTLFNMMPNKNTKFISEYPYSFLAGLIDGDGYKKKNSAILVQYYNISTMKALSKSLGLKESVFKVKTNYGNSVRRQYYIPRNVCDILRSGRLSEKLK